MYLKPPLDKSYLVARCFQAATQVEEKRSWSLHIAGPLEAQPHSDSVPSSFWLSLSSSSRLSELAVANDCFNAN